MTDHLTPDPPLGDGAAPALPDHLSAVIAGHRAFRRDTARFIKALGRAGADDRTTTARLVAWFDAATAALLHHHTIEDEILWPALRGRSRAFAALEPRIRDQHRALDAAIGTAVDAVRTFATVDGAGREAARRAAEEAVVRMRAILVEHLDDEEAVALPLLGEAFTPEEFRKLERAGRELFARKELAFDACWYLDTATPGEHAVIWAGLPRSLRVRYRLRLRRSHRRVSAVLPVAREPLRSSRPEDPRPTPATPHDRPSRRPEGPPMSRPISTTARAETSAPFAAVWDLVSDLDRYAEWVHGTLEVIDAAPVAAVGATYTERNRIIGPLSARSVWTVVALDREAGHQRHESEGIPGLSPFAVLVTVTSTSTGTTVELTLEGVVSAGPLTRPIAWLMLRTLRPSNERTLRDLAALIEREVGEQDREAGEQAATAPVNEPG
jgi:hypothetical protein